MTSGYVLAAMALLTNSSALARTFGHAHTLVTGSGEVLSSAAIDAEGDAIVAWTAATSAGFVAAASYRPAGGEWSHPKIMTTYTGYVVPPQVRFAADGSATVVASEVPAAGTASTYAMDLKPGGGWSKVHVVNGLEGGQVAFAMDSDGSSAIAGIVRNPVSVALSRRRAPGSEWKLPETVAYDVGESAVVTGLAVAPGGDALVAWQPQNLICAPICQLEYAQAVSRARHKNATWSTFFLPEGSSTNYQIAFPLLDARHRAAVIYAAPQLGTPIQAVTAGPDGVWGSPANLVSDVAPAYPQPMGATIDSTGRAVLGLLQLNGPVGFSIVNGKIPQNKWGRTVDLSKHDHKTQPYTYPLFDDFTGNTIGGAAMIWDDTTGNVRVRARVMADQEFGPIETAGGVHCAKDAPSCNLAEAVALNDTGEMVATWSAPDTESGTYVLNVATTH